MYVTNSRPTKASGFLGSELTRQLLAQGVNAIGVDIFQTGRRKDLSEFEVNPKFRPISITQRYFGEVNARAYNKNRHDVTKAIGNLPKIHQIYHLACPASSKQYQRDAIRTSTLGFRGY